MIQLTNFAVLEKTIRLNSLWLRIKTKLKTEKGQDRTQEKENNEKGIPRDCLTMKNGSEDRVRQKTSEQRRESERDKDFRRVNFGNKHKREEWEMRNKHGSWGFEYLEEEWTRVIFEDLEVADLRSWEVEMSQRCKEKNRWEDCWLLYESLRADAVIDRRGLDGCRDSGRIDQWGTRLLSDEF